jgi:hypothetical protein
MADDDTYDPNADWIEPKRVYMDDLLIVDPVLGKVPFWKSLIYNSAMLRNAVERQQRNDSVDPTPLLDEDKPPPVAADEGTLARAGQLSDEDLAKIDKAIDLLDQRLTQLEAKRDAERKLEDLEDALEATGIAPNEDGQIKLN